MAARDSREHSSMERAFTISRLLPPAKNTYPRSSLRMALASWLLPVLTLVISSRSIWMG